MNLKPGLGVMPIDREAWGKQLGLCNFINSYYQFRDLTLFPSVKRILIVGPGQGLDPVILRWRGFDVTTFDIDETFSPDVIGSVHQMDMFSESEFDVVIASHVLEHLPLEYLDPALSEIARIAHHALIYLPVNGLAIQLRFLTNFRNLCWSNVIDVRKWWSKPSSKVPRYMSGQHYWEIGVRGCSLKKITDRMLAFFEVKSVYRNQDWTPSMNFALTSRLHSQSIVAGQS